jgi:hypothetical protein
VPLRCFGSPFCDKIVVLDGVLMLLELLILGQPSSMTIKVVDLA